MKNYYTFLLKYYNNFLMSIMRPNVEWLWSANSNLIIVETTFVEKKH